MSMRNRNAATLLPNALAKCLIAGAILTACHLHAGASAVQFHDWTAGSGSGVQTWTNTSSAGTISGTSACPGCWGAPTGTFGVADAINPPGPTTFTTEFNANGGAPGSSVNFVFSPGYAWGTGGKLILGNIHNYFEYRLEAWDFAGVAKNVNAWMPPTEYAHGQPGQLGYFSTSSTNCAVDAADSDDMLCSVSDSAADANSGQGGVLLFAGLMDIGRIKLTLTRSDLAPNNQSSDFILFNVGTPVPEPTTLLLTLAAGFAGFVARQKKQPPQRG